MQYPILSAYLTVDDAVKAIEFYKTAFGATERFRLAVPETGIIGHAELEIEGGLLMLSEASPQWGTRSPSTLGGTPCKMCLIVPNADVTFKKAIDAGATVTMEPADMFYGFRSSAIRDPFGHEWMIQHKIKDVSPEDMQTAWEQMLERGCAN